MEDDAHQPDELNRQLRVKKTYLKARYRLSDLVRAQRNDGMTSNLKMWIENGAQVCLVPNPISKSSVVLGRRFSVTR